MKIFVFFFFSFGENKEVAWFASRLNLWVLYSSSWHNVVNQLYVNKIKVFKKELRDWKGSEASWDGVHNCPLYPFTKVLPTHVGQSKFIQL